MSSIVSGTVSAVYFEEGSFVEKGSVVLELESRAEALDVRRREVVLDNLKSTLERSETLLKNSSAISMEEVDTTRSEFKMAQLELELAKDSLLKKRVVAPFSGILTDLPLEVGEFCEPPQILLRMVDTRQFYCIANIDPAASGQLELGGAVEYVAESGIDSKIFRGKIVFISPVIDPASGLLRIKSIFSNPDGEVRPGEGGHLELSPTS